MEPKGADQLPPESPPQPPHPPHSRRPEDGPGISDELAALAAGIVRLEEHAGFTEHTVEQLSEEMAALGRRVQELSRRIETIERRIGELAQPSEASAPTRPGGGAAGASGGEAPPPA